MNEIELINSLKYLVNKYIYDEKIRDQIISELDSTKYNDIGVKGILAEIQTCGVNVDSSDSKIIKDIVFNYC